MTEIETIEARIAKLEESYKEIEATLHTILSIQEHLGAVMNRNSEICTGVFLATSSLNVLQLSTFVSFGISAPSVVDSIQRLQQDYANYLGADTDTTQHPEMRSAVQYLENILTTFTTAAEFIARKQSGQKLDG